MDFRDLATQIVMNKIGGTQDAGTARSALDDLLGGNKQFDLVDIVGQFRNSGGDLAGKAKSWLGDGDNDTISSSQIQDVIGIDKIESFARKLGIGSDEASGKLSEILPELIDKSSRGGSLLDSVSSIKDLGDLASKFLR